jgi:hypothetical protein
MQGFSASTDVFDWSTLQTSDALAAPQSASTASDVSALFYPLAYAEGTMPVTIANLDSPLAYH